jgi:hypothetical protein
MGSALNLLMGKNSALAQAAKITSALDTTSWSQLSGLRATSALDTVVGKNSAFALAQAAGISSTLDGVLGKNSAFALAQAAGINSALDTTSWSQLSGLRATSALDTVVGKNSAFALAQAAGINSALEATSSLAGWQQSMLGARSATALASMSALLGDPSTRTLLADLARTSSLTARLASAAASSITRTPHQWPSQLPAIRLGAYLRGLRPESPERDLLIGVSAGSSVSALLTVDVLSHEHDDDAREHTAELFEDDVAESWLSGPAQARADLLEALDQLGEDLPDLLIGAWEDVARAGAAAAVKISTCAVEVLERTLRALAPDGDVLSWHAQGGRSSDELSNGRPTHACRVRYLLRAPAHAKHRQLIPAQVESIVVVVNELRGVFQGGKHASSGDVSVLRGCLMSVEAVLHQLTVALR